MVLADFFTDRSDELRNGGDTIHTPNLSEMTANAKVNAQAVTLNSPQDTKVDLVVNQWFEVSFAIEDREAAQVMRSYYIQEKMAKNAGFTIAKKLEVAIASLFAGFSQSVGASTTSITDSDLRAAIGILSGNNVDMDRGNIAFFIDSKVAWSQLMGIDKFALAINSPTADPIMKGMMGYLYGIPVVTSNHMQYVSGSTGRVGVLAERDAIHFATSPLGASSKAPSMVGTNGVRVMAAYVPQYLHTQWTSDILYGVIENRDLSGVRILSSAV